MKSLVPKQAAAVLIVLGLCTSASGCRTASDTLHRVQDALPAAETVQNALPGIVDTVQDKLSEVLLAASRYSFTNLDRQGFSLQHTIDDFCAALDSRNAEGIKALFAPNVLMEDTDIDNQIKALFALYSGPTDECYVTRTPGGSGHIGFMENRFTTSAWIPVVSQGANYYCYMSLTTTDQADSNNLGIQKLVFVPEKVKCSTDFIWPEEKGLTVVADVPGDYLTCRIGDDAYIYTPVDRVVTQEEIQAFLEKNDSWEAFSAHFGPPNATGEYSGNFYELPDEDGEKRYANIAVSTSTGRVYGAYLYNGKNHHTLDVLWKPEEGPEE